jgi:hypothetical protein
VRPTIPLVKRSVVSGVVSRHNHDVSVEQSRFEGADPDLKIDNHSIHEQQPHYLVNLSARARKVQKKQTAELQTRISIVRGVSGEHSIDQGEDGVRKNYEVNRATLGSNHVLINM